MAFTLAGAVDGIKRRRKLLVRILIVLLALWLLFLALTAWGIPRLVRSVALAQVPEALGRTARMGEVSFNPFKLRLRVHDFAILDQAGAKPDFSVEQVEVNASISSLFRLAPVVDGLAITAPRVSLVREGPQRFNISDILDRLAAKPSEDGPPPRFSLNNVKLDGGEITVDDKVTGRQHTVRDLQVGIPFLSTLAYATDIDVQPRLSALVNGSPFNLEGTARPFDTPRTSSLHLKIDDLGLDALADAVPGAMPVALKHARLDSDAQLVFEEGGSAAPKIRLEGQATVREVDVRDQGDAALLAFKSLALEKFALEPLARRFQAERIVLAGPSIHASRSADGRVNLAEVAARFQQPAAPAPAPAAPAPASVAPAQADAWHVSVGTVALQDGELAWHDEQDRFDYRISEFAAELRDLKLPAAQDQAVPLTVAARVGEAGRLDVSGPIRLQPFSADLDLKLDSLALPALAPLWKPYLALRIDDGSLGAAAKLHVEQGDSLAVRWGDGSVALRKLAAAPVSDKASSLKLESLEVGGLAGDLAGRTARIERIAIDGLALAATRSASSAVSWADIVVPAAPGARSAGKPAPAPAGHAPAAWKVTAGTLSVAKSSLRLTDESVSPRVALRLDGLQMEARNVGSDLRAPVDFSLRSSVQGRGTADIKGTVVPEPLSVKAQVRASRLDLAALAPYLAERLNATVKSVVAGANGRLEFAAATGRQPQRAAWTGAAEITNLDLIDKLNSADFLKWKRLAFKRLNVVSAGETLKADLGDISLEDFFARVILSEQGRLNLSQLIVQPGEEAGSITAEKSAEPAAKGESKPPAAAQDTKEASAAASEAGGMPRDIRVGAVQLARGHINFTDNFVKPNYRANLTDIAGSISAVSSADSQPADVQVTAKVDGDAPVDITGKLHPFGPRLYTDIHASAKGVELPALTPYAAKYAGYAIERGKLSMDVHYLIQDGKLQATNKIFLDQLTFGERVDSPDALKLPVQLAVSLLKNSRGEIDIELPISGSLDDPQFSVGGIIFRALINLITRAVTAPFSLLASAFGSGEELSHIDFAPGSARLDDGARKRIDTLVKALNDRPGLRLDVAGRANPTVDTDGLRKAGVEAMIRAQQREDLRKRGDEAGDKDLPPLDAAQRARYLESAYKAAKIDKPRNMIGLAKSIPDSEMESLLAASVNVGPDQLRALAVRRAQAVMAPLREAKLGERAFVVAPRVEAKPAEGGVQAGVDFSLK
ncbi:DUF748 domain-containing protein [Pigmentiphaga sp. H8]|uniref:DUF748 domain-containing protein n=1 Tax=Pigmentiphaga sp. H8 TaxID=2488560 RepID=UPI000F591588|nr:DUF748 domain-containing protein [Pigmentiphaga sp. H8]AZG07439.1 DUF748 domain-containing protein [Pigmentiphaga sp. H8]